MEAILDTNFILSCLKKNIDFTDELENLGFVPVVPREVIQEMKDLRIKVSHDERMVIDVALSLLENNRKLKKTRLGGKSVDEGLIAKGKEGIYIATLDSTVKRSIPNRVVISDAKRGLMVERA